MSVSVALLVAVLTVRAVGGNVRRARAWALVSLAVALVALHLALPWVWVWLAHELDAVVGTCALVGGLGGALLLPVCERLGAGLLRWSVRAGLLDEDEVRSQLHFSAAAQEARALRQQGVAVEAIAGRVRAAFLLPEESARRLVQDSGEATEGGVAWEP